MMPQVAPPPKTDLTQVDLHSESDGGAIVHVVLCRHLQGQAPGLPGSSKGPKHVPHSELRVCLVGSSASAMPLPGGPGAPSSSAHLPGGEHRAARAAARHT